MHVSQGHEDHGQGEVQGSKDHQQSSERAIYPEPWQSSCIGHADNADVMSSLALETCNLQGELQGEPAALSEGRSMRNSPATEAWQAPLHSAASLCLSVLILLGAHLRCMSAKLYGSPQIV